VTIVTSEEAWQSIGWPGLDRIHYAINKGPSSCCRKKGARGSGRRSGYIMFTKAERRRRDVVYKYEAYCAMRNSSPSKAQRKPFPSPCKTAGYLVLATSNPIHQHRSSSTQRLSSKINQQSNPSSKAKRIWPDTSNQSLTLELKAPTPPSSNSPQPHPQTFQNSHSSNTHRPSHPQSAPSPPHSSPRTQPAGL